MPAPRQVDHIDVGAYVLGILDEPDQAAFAQHFAHCAQCRAEYRELSDLPMLLDQLKPARRDHGRTRAPATPGKRVLGHVLDRVTETRRTRTRMLLLAAAAVIVLLVAVPVIVLRSASGSGGQVAGPASTVTVSFNPPTTSSTLNTGTDVVAGARTVTGKNDTAGINATIGIEPQPWGTKINLELRMNSGPVPCQLVAVSRSAETQTLMNWQVPAAGVGTVNSPEPLRLEGTSGFASEDIDRFELRRSDGGAILLAIEA